MRTVIFLGLIAIADAINTDWSSSQTTIKAYSIVLIGAIIMDIWDFFNNYKDER